MDPLTDVLSTVRLQSAVFSRADVQAPWAVSTQGAQSGIFHAVVRGSCCIRVTGGTGWEPLGAGDVALIPHGRGHILADAPNRRATPIQQLVETCEDGPDLLRVRGPGPSTFILCGTFVLDHGDSHPLVGSLPELLCVRGGDGPGAEWVATTLRWMAREVDAPAAGGQVVLSRLADVLVVHALRAHMEALPANTRGWLAALRDPVVSRALALIHKKPAFGWTAASLAARVGVSRSALFSRFTRLVGEAPAAYLARWRVHVAARVLRDEQAVVKEVAARVGYGSEAALSKAFKRLLGRTPAEVRADV
jgi:AraC-like DNA-binding protein